MNILPLDEPPTFVNDIGVKWWLDTSSTNYAQRPDYYGTTLPNITAWIVQTSNGYTTRCLTDSNTNQIVYESQALDGIGSKIDMLKAMERFGV